MHLYRSLANASRRSCVLRRFATAAGVPTPAPPAAGTTASASSRAKRRAVTFTGQGSQRLGMGDDLTAPFDGIVRHVWEEANTAIGFNLRQIMSAGPRDTLTLTENAQPAILAHSIAIWRILQSELELRSADRYCSVLFGHSLGEYTALCAAGALSFTDAIKLVRERGLAMAKVGRSAVGGTAMAALMPCSLPLAEAIVKRTRADAPAGSGWVCDIANINSDSQVVLSGHARAIDAAIAIAQSGTANGRKVRRAIRLDVSAPFHSQLMHPAVTTALQRLLVGSSAQPPAFALKPPAVPLLANVNARPQSDPKQLAALLVEQAAKPVLWRDSLRYAVRELGVTEVVECGPAPVLTPLIRQCDFNDAPNSDAASTAAAGVLARERPAVSGIALHSAESIVQYIKTFKD